MDQHGYHHPPKKKKKQKKNVMTSKVLIGGFREQLICFGKWHFLNILFLSPRGFYSRLDFPLFFKVIDLDSC